MPVVYDLSDKGSSGEPPDKKKKNGQPDPKAAMTKAARKKAALEETFFEKNRTIILVVVIVVALAFTGYYFVKSRQPTPTNELNQLNGVQPGATNQSPAARAGQAASGGGTPNMPRPGEGPVPMPRFGGQGATGSR